MRRVACATTPIHAVEVGPHSSGQHHKEAVVAIVHNDMGEGAVVRLFVVGIVLVAHSQLLPTTEGQTLARHV
jgi:hypothetical protein